MLPIKYNGMKIFVAGSKTVIVSIKLADIVAKASNISTTNAILLL
jgi:hypothetical protein